ncbi:MAG TPA: ABC transporter permease [bacterium]|nr:ABC transporter permease [bacterium]
MSRLLLARLAQTVLTLFTTVTFVFAAGHLSGNPADVILPMTTTPAERAAYIHLFGFDKPLYQQYAIYLGGVATGNFGDSITYRRPVLEIIIPRLFNTAKLAALALLITLVVGIPVGAAAAVWRGRWVDHLAMGTAVTGQSIPTFASAILLISVVSVWLRLLPASGMESWQSYILPAVTIAWFMAAGIVRLLRSSLLDVLDAEYIKIARAKGLSEAVVLWKHAFRNATIPLTTFVGLIFGIILTSAVTVEIVYNWPGIASLIYSSILHRDYPLTQAAVTATAAIIVLLNLAVDLLYIVLDPRIHL